MAIATLGSASTDTTETSSSGTSVSSTMSHTQSAGSNRILIVSGGFSWNGGAGETFSVAGDYNGTSMTTIEFNYADTGSTVRGNYILRLMEADLPSNGTYTITVTVSHTGSAASDFRGICSVGQHFSGVDQTSPVRDSDQVAYTSEGMTSVSIDLTTVSGDWCVDGLHKNNGTTGVTIGSGQTQIAGAGPSANGFYSVMSYEEATTTTTTMSWTMTGTGATYAAAALVPDSGGGGTNMQINVNDAWKTVDAIKINVNDAWKDVDGATVNVNDAWKTIF